MYVVNMKKSSAGTHFSLGIKGVTWEIDHMDAVNVMIPSSESHNLVNII